MCNCIQHLALKLMLFIQFIALFGSCKASSIQHLEDYKKKTLILNSKEELTVFIAKSISQQKLGLSGVKDEDFKDHYAMLFPGDKMEVRQFWMPETFFDLDLFFLNEDFYILEVQRKLKHSPFKSYIKRPRYSKEVFCQHVLEMKSSSPLSKKLKPGMTLKWKKKALTP